MHKQAKKIYQAPTIKVVEMKVERGFQGTQGTFNAINNAAGASSTDGTEAYIAPTNATTGWF